MYTFLVVTLFFLAGCASAPTRVNVLGLENYGLTSDIELNGVLISHGDKFILDKSFQAPEARIFGVVFTDIPAGPWEFTGSTLFPEFESRRIPCPTSDCDHYNQLKGPFVHLDCLTNTPRSSNTYSRRVNDIEYEKTKVGAEDTKLRGQDVAALVVVVPVMALLAPFGAIQSTLSCSAKNVWFDHDMFFDTVKGAIIKDYGSIDAYVADIRQASMAYAILANIDKDKREEIEVIVLEWDRSVRKRLPENDRLYNYLIQYSPYSLAKIPRKADWSRKLAVIESDLLSHYTEQLVAINRQRDSYNKTFKQKHGIYIMDRP